MRNVLQKIVACVVILGLLSSNLLFAVASGENADAFNKNDYTKVKTISFSDTDGDTVIKKPDSNYVVGGTNWGEGYKGLGIYTDAYTTQRTAAGDATITLKVMENMALEFVFIVAADNHPKITNTFYASTDNGASWTNVNAHIKRLADIDGADNSVTVDMIVDSYQVCNLPAGINQLKIVTSGGAAWSAGFDSIDFYTLNETDDDTTEDAFNKNDYTNVKNISFSYDAGDSVINSPDSNYVVGGTNWSEGNRGLGIYTDAYTTQRAGNISGSDTATITLKVRDTMALEFVFIVAADNHPKVKNTFYASTNNGASWTKIDANIKRLADIDGADNSVTVDMIVDSYQISNLPAGTNQLKVETSGGANWSAGFDSIDFYLLKGTDGGDDNTGDDQENESIDADLFDKNDYTNVKNISFSYAAGDSVITSPDTNYVVGGTNWNEGNRGLGIYTDAYTTQRAGNVSGSDMATITLKVTDAMALEFVFIAAADNHPKIKNNFFASTDNGATWTKVKAGIKRLADIDGADNSVTVDMIVDSYQISNLPAGTNQLKVETVGGANWSAGFDSIDFYLPKEGDDDGNDDGGDDNTGDDQENESIDADLFDKNGYTNVKNISFSYDAGDSVINSPDSNYVVGGTNWSEGNKGLGIYTDAYTTQRAGNISGSDMATITLKVTDAMALEFVFIAAADNHPKIKNNFFASTDNGATWTKVKAGIKRLADIDGADNSVTVDMIVDSYQICNLPAGTNQLKVETVGGANWSAGFDSIDFYLPKEGDDGGDDNTGDGGNDDDDNVGDNVADAFDKNDYTLKKSIHFTNEPGDSLRSPDYKYIVGSANWNDGNKGLGVYTDIYTTQRAGEITGSATATITMKAKDTMALEFVFIVAADNHPKVKNTFFASTDGGTTWTEVEANVKRLANIAGKDNTLTVDVIVDAYQICNLPAGTNRLKVETSGGANWSAGFDSIEFYVLNGTDDGDDEEDDNVDAGIDESKWDKQHRLGFSGPKDDLATSVIVVDHDNWQSGYKGYSYTDDYSTQRPNSEAGCGDAYITISVTDRMLIEMASVMAYSFDSKVVNTFYVSPDGIEFTPISRDVIETVRVDNDDLAAKQHFVRIERVTELPAGTNFLKIVTSTGNEQNTWWSPGIDYIDLYVPEGEVVDDSNLPQAEYDMDQWQSFGGVGFKGPKDNLSDSQHIVEFKNWESGSKGYVYRDQYTTQRPNSEEGNKDAYIVVSVRDDMLIEMASVIATGWDDKVANSFYVSADGKTYTRLSLKSIETIKVENAELTEKQHFVRVERVSNFPEGTKFVKIVTSTGNSPHSWWTPGIDYIDLYVPRVVEDPDEEIIVRDGLLRLMEQADSEWIMITGDFIIINLNGGAITVDKLASKFDAGINEPVFFDAAGNQMSRKAYAEEGMVLKVIGLGEVFGEYIISLMLAGEPPTDEEGYDGFWGNGIFNDAFFDDEFFDDKFFDDEIPDTGVAALPSLLTLVSALGAVIVTSKRRKIKK